MVRSLIFVCCVGFVGSSLAQDAKTPKTKDLPDGVRFRLGSDRFREASYITGVALSTDGKTLAVCNGTLQIRLLDVATGNELRRFGIKEYLRNEQLFFTPDAKRIITASYNNTNIFDATNGTVVKQIANANRDGRDGHMALSGDGQWLAVGSQSENGQVRVLELATGNAIATVKPVQNASVYGAISHDGSLLATWGQHYNRGGAGEDHLTILRTVQVWNVKDAKVAATLVTDSANVQAVRFSRDGKKIATAGMGVVQMWDAQTGKVERRFAGRTGQGMHVAFAPDGQTIAAISADNCVQTWDTTTGKRLSIMAGGGQQARGLQYTPTGQLLVWTWTSNALEIWDGTTGKRLTPDGGHRSPLQSLQFTPDGKTLFSVSNDGRLLRWNTHTGEELETFELRELADRRRAMGSAQTNMGPVYFSPNGKYMIGGSASSGGSGNVALWDVEAGMELLALTHPGGYVDRNGIVAFSPDSRKLVAASRYGNREQGANIPLWDVESGAPLPTCSGQKGDLTCGGFSTDGKLLVTCSYSYQPMGGQVSEAWCWDLTTGKPIAKTIVNNVVLTRMQFLDHRLFVAVTQNFQPIKVYDALTGQEVRVFEGNVQNAPMVALSPDRRFLAAGTQEGPDRYGPDGMLTAAKKRVTVWEVASGSIRAELPLIDSLITAVAFSPDGKTLAVGCNDTTIFLWDMTPKTVKAEPLSATQLADDWKALELPPAKAADALLARWSARPQEVVPFLQTQLKPVPTVKVDATQIAKLIADLDAARYPVREAAMRDLERMGSLAKEAITAALKMNPSPEVRERLEKLVNKVNKPDTGAEWLRPLRAIEVLERSGTPDAKRLLQELAAGGDAPSTRMAQEAVRRLAK